MKVMILAAGLGQRMRPLTDSMPKPLLRVAGRPLLEHHIRRLAAAGCTDLVINVSHLAEQILAYFGNGEAFGVAISWSVEQEPLETAGGIINALPLLGEDAFGVVNGDVWTDYPFVELTEPLSLPGTTAKLILVDNPPQHPGGDFILAPDGWIGHIESTTPSLTYAGIGIYTAAFFAGIAPGKVALKPLLDRAIDKRTLAGCHYRGRWVDVGTPARLEALNVELQSAAQQ